jgi:hypothetical protein
MLRPDLKVRIARDWLLCIACLLIGGLLLPVAIMLVLVHEIRLAEFYAALVGSDKDFEARILAWLVFVGPYLLIQLGRSIWWAYRIIGRREPVVFIRERKYGSSGRDYEESKPPLYLDKK